MKPCRFCRLRGVFHEGDDGCSCLLCSQRTACPPNDPRHPLPRRIPLDVVIEDLEADLAQQRRIDGYRRAQARKVRV